MKSILNPFFKLFVCTLLIIQSLQVTSQVSTEDDRAVCTNYTTVIANYPGGIWTTDRGANIINASSTSTLVTDMDYGANKFTYTVGGVGSDFVIITNNSVIANAGADRLSSCLDYADLSGSSSPIGVSGQWSLKYNTPGVIIDNTSVNITQAHNLPFGNTIFVWNVSANGCSDLDEVSINNSKPENNDGADNYGCTNTFYLSAETPPVGGSGLWGIAPGSPIMPAFNTTNNPDVEITAPIGTSVVRWSITYNACSSFKDFIIVNNLPNPYAGVDQAVCLDEVLLAATSPNASEQGVWSIANPQGEIFTDKSVHNPTVTKLKQGTSTFTWTLSNAYCSASDFMQVVNNRPSLNAGADNTICENVYTLSADNPSPNIGTWSSANTSIAFDDIHSFSTKVSNLASTSNTLTWTVINGSCTAADNIIITSYYAPISAGSDKSACSDILDLAGTPAPATGSGFWSITFGTGSIDNSASNITTARNLGEITNFKWTINSGLCTFTDEIEYINLLSSIAILPVNADVCSDNAILRANPTVELNEYGVWTIVSAAANTAIVSPSLYQTRVNNLKAGINTFKWTIYNQNCSSSDNVDITNNSITTNAGSDEIICSNSYKLNAINAGGTGYWTTTASGVVFTNSTSPTSDITNLAFGSTTFKWNRMDLGCTANDEVVITNNMPDNVYAGADKIACENMATLSAENPLHGTGLWTVFSGTGTFSKPSLYQNDVTGLSSGPNVYRWTVSYQACSRFDDVTITNKHITVSAGQNQIVCNQPVVSLLGTQPASGQSGAWSLIGGNGVFSNSASYNSDVTGLIRGINTFKWTLSDAACSNHSQVSITNNTPDAAVVNDDQIICANNTTINAIPVVDGFGSWSLVSGGGTIQNISLYNNSVTNIPKGPNKFRWTVDKSGCLLTDDILVTNNSVDAIIPLNSYNVCSSLHSITLTANQLLSGETGKWSRVSGSSGTIESPSNYSTIISNLNNGESRYKWTVNSSICSAFDEVSVVDDYYTANAATVGTSNLCVNSGSVIATAPPASGVGLWSANNASVTFSNVSSANTTVKNLPLGSSIITWTIINNNCLSPASFSMSNNSIIIGAGNDIIGCSTNATLNAQALLPGQSGVWTTVFPVIVFGNNQDPKSSISNIPEGTSQVTWTVSANGCTASDNLNVTNQIFSVSAGNDITICATTYPLTASDPLVNGTGLWSVVEGNGIISSPTKYNSGVSNLGNGNNIFKWTVVRNGCIAFDDVTIINDLYIAQATSPTNVCINDVLVSAAALPTGSGTSGVWSTLLGGGVFDNPNSPETMVRGMSPGANKFKWTVSKGLCISSKTIDVSNDRLVISAGTDQITCANYSNLFATSLTATGLGTWSSTNPSVTISSPNSPITNVENIGKGLNTFMWNVVDKSCTANATVTITNNDFTIDAGADQIVKTATALMNAQLPDQTATGQWMVLNGNGIFGDYSNPKSDVSNYSYGSNNYRWSVYWNGCNSSDDITIIYDVAEAYAGNDQVTCYNTAILFAEQPTMGTGIWSVVSGTGQIQNPASYRTEVTNISRGTNIYRWTVTAFGATAYDEVNVNNNSFTVNAGSDQQTCNLEVILDAEDAGIGATGLWYIFQGSGVFENNANNKTKVSGLMVGNNRYIWDVVRNGCQSTDTVLITHYQPTTTADAGKDATICDKTEYMLAANSPTIGKGLWTADKTAISFVNTAQANSKVINLTNGANTLWWTISNTNCKSVDEIIVSARKSVSIKNQPASKHFNEGENALLVVEINGDAEFYEWQKDGAKLVNSDRISGANEANLTISNLKNSDIGNYQCVITGYCNSLKTDIAAISVVSGIDEPEMKGVKIYPNPSKGIVHINIENELNMSDLIITNLNGEQVYKKHNLDKTEILDLTNFADGIYIITIRKDNNLIKNKLILQK